MSHTYLSIYDIAWIQQDQIKRFGGLHGIRDKGALDAACYRPQCGYYHTIQEEAAALMESLAMNHPFLDGNKRTAFAACDTFLRVNGKKIYIEPFEAYTEIMSLFDTHEFNMTKLTLFLNKHSTPH